MTGDFTHAGYRRLIESLLGRGYKVRGFSDAEPDAPHLILRHDIDLSIDAALPIAEIERELGVSATFFVLLRTEFYNPFSGEGLAGLRRLAALGHDIGLHFDAALYDDEPEALDQAAAAECDALEAFLQRPVTMISFHRPARNLLGYEAPLAGRRHAYEPRYFSEMGYCSDSRGGWHHGHPLEHEAVAAGRALQLLTHPEWWSAAPEHPGDRLARFLGERAAFLERELAGHCTIEGRQAAGAKNECETEGGASG